MAATRGPQLNLTKYIGYTIVAYMGRINCVIVAVGRRFLRRIRLAVSSMPTKPTQKDSEQQGHRRLPQRTIIAFIRPILSLTMKAAANFALDAQLVASTPRLL
jgi:hypothetical protein